MMCFGGISLTAFGLWGQIQRPPDSTTEGLVTHGFTAHSRWVRTVSPAIAAYKRKRYAAVAADPLWPIWLAEAACAD